MDSSRRRPRPPTARAAAAPRPASRGPPARSAASSGAPTGMPDGPGPASSSYVQRGFGLKADVAPILARDYDSGVVAYLRANGFQLPVGELTIRLAKEFGFCYGVE